MRDQHIHREIENLGVDLKVLGDALMDGPVPLLCILLHARGRKANAIAPKVTHLSDLVIELPRLH